MNARHCMWVILTVWSLSALGKMSTIFEGQSAHNIRGQIGHKHVDVGNCYCGDCFAILMNQVNYCVTDDCKAIITKNSGACTTPDCKVFIEFAEKYTISKINDGELAAMGDRCTTGCCKLIITNSGHCGGGGGYSYHVYLTEQPQIKLGYVGPSDDILIKGYISRVNPAYGSYRPPLSKEEQAKHDREAQARLDEANIETSKNIQKETRYEELLGRRIHGNGKDDKKYRRIKEYSFDNPLYRSSYNAPLSDAEEAEFKVLYQALYGSKKDSGNNGCVIC